WRWRCSTPSTWIARCAGCWPPAPRHCTRRQGATCGPSSAACSGGRCRAPSGTLLDGHSRMVETADRVAAAGRRGLTTRVRRGDGAPVGAVRLWLNGGTRGESIPGQGLLTGRMLEEGTRRRDWRRIAADAEGRGMELSSFGAFEGHGVNVDALAPDWELALEWAAELVREPSFPEDRCAWLGKQAAAELEGLADQPDVKSAWGFLEHLYTPHPRCRPVLGDVASLRTVTAADCAGLHRSALAGGIIAAVAGVI